MPLLLLGHFSLFAYTPPHGYHLAQSNLQFEKKQFIDAAAFGFSPQALGMESRKALQNALD